MSANKVLSYFDELSRQIALRLHIPWAEPYIPYLIAAIVLYLLFVIVGRMLRPAARVVSPFQRLRRYLSDRARSSAERKAVRKKIRAALAGKDYRLAADLYRSINEFGEAARLYLEAGEYASAAKTCEDAGEYEKAALYYREAENNSKAAENFLKIHDYRNAALMYEKGGFFHKAAELFDRAGDYARSAELYEVCFIEEGLHKPGGSSGERYASLSGNLFQKAGHFEKAIHILLKANLHNEAAVIYEAKGDFINAAECFLQRGELERAAECFQKGGNPGRSSEILSAIYYKKGLIKEAASFAEKAGDLLQASEMFMEAGEYAKAGELLLRKGYFSEAAEAFLKIMDFLRAGEAYEKGEEYVLAADAYHKLDDKNWKLKAAAFYEKGGKYFDSGELLLELDLTDRALSAFQKIDRDSVHYTTASVLIGKIFLEKGMIKLAMEKFSKVIGGEPVSKSNLEAYYYLGLCYEASGEKEKAREVYEKILAEDYQFRDVRRKLSEL